MALHLPPRLKAWTTVACLFGAACLMPLTPAAIAEPDMPPTTGQSTVDIAHHQQLDYLIHLPADYDVEADRTWPLVIFLHGAGERGNDLEKLKKWGPPKFIEEQTLPAELQQAIIVSPQCPADQWWANDTMIASLDQMFADILADHAVDIDRVYLTGVSMGGYGTWAWAGRNPRRFAAVAPVCGGATFFHARTIARAKLPLWTFHGDRDPIVPLSETVAAFQPLQQQNHTGPDARLTVFPNTQHNSWTPAYATAELWAWMFSHRRTAASDTTD